MKSALISLLIFLSLFSIAIARPDNRTYLNSVTTPAVWINPRQIKVYITYDEGKMFLFKRAFKAWDDALGSNLNFVYVDNKDEADISIAYVKRLNGAAIGLTRPLYVKIQGKTYLSNATIKIARQKPTGAIQSDSELYHVILHEIGHAIGILGHSNSIYDVMYPTNLSVKNQTLSTKDIDTVKKMYGF